MSLSRLFTMILLLVLSLLFSACSSKQEGTSQGEKPSSVSAPPSSAPSPEPAPSPTQPAPSAESPSVPSQEQARSTPEDFPLPIMEGLKVVSTLSTRQADRSGKQLELTGKVEPVRIAEFYEAEFRKRGLSIRKSQGDSAHGGEILLLGTSETVTAGLIVTRDDESGETRAVLSWSEGK